MFRTMENNKVVLILVAHVDDLQVSGSETVCEELLGVINGQIFTENIQYSLVVRSRNRTEDRQ